MLHSWWKKEKDLFLGGILLVVLFASLLEFLLIPMEKSRRSLVFQADSLQLVLRESTKKMTREKSPNELRHRLDVLEMATLGFESHLVDLADLPKQDDLKNLALSLGLTAKIAQTKEQINNELEATAFGIFLSGKSDNLLRFLDSLSLRYPSAYPGKIQIHTEENAKMNSVLKLLFYGKVRP